MSTIVVPPIVEDVKLRAIELKDKALGRVKEVRSRLAETFPILAPPVTPARRRLRSRFMRKNTPRAWKGSRNGLSLQFKPRPLPASQTPFETQSTLQLKNGTDKIMV